MTRGVIALVAPVLCCALVACSPDAAPEPASSSAASGSLPSSTTTSGRATAQTPSRSAVLEAVPAWVPGPGEISPEVKATATRFLEAAGTWADGDGDPAGLAARLDLAGHTPDIAATVVALADPLAEAASLQVVYPQYGGLTVDSSSVMTVVRQRLLDPSGEVRERELALDVRLGLGEDSVWKVVGVVPTEPQEGQRPLSAAAEAVLANDNVNLPGPAEEDLRQGLLDDTLLQVLDGLGQEFELDVQVLHDGHPVNVFATDRVSNHNVGRAVDIWRVDGRPVVDPGTPRALLDSFMVRAGELGATEVGGPYDLNGRGPGYFTDLVHRDHLHVGVSPGRPAAAP